MSTIWGGTLGATLIDGRSLTKHAIGRLRRRRHDGEGQRSERGGRRRTQSRDSSAIIVLGVLVYIEKVWPTLSPSTLSRELSVGGHVSAGYKIIWEPRGFVRAEIKRDTVTCVFFGVATAKFSEHACFRRAIYCP